MAPFLGTVASTRYEANQAGMQILAKGGNAVDAAVAMSFVLAVVEPYMTGPGAVGELLYLTPGGSCQVVDCAARAPRQAFPRMYRIVGAATGMYGWPEVEKQANTYGALSVVAPRLVSGLFLAHQKFGRLAWPDILQPAIDLAEDGFDVDYFFSAVLTHEMPYLSRDPVAGPLFYPGGTPLTPPVEDPPISFRNEDLFSTLKLIASLGDEALKSGPLADAILQLSHQSGGILDDEDLKGSDGFLIQDTTPLVHFRGWSVYASPLPSGGVTVAEILGLLDQFEKAGEDPRDAQRYERTAMACCYAFKDRLARLSGSDSPDNTLALLAEDHLRVGADFVESGYCGAGPSAAGPHPATATTHLSVVDAEGGCVSLTQTLLSLFGSHLGVPGCGFILNNGMMWFDPSPGSPNSIASGARALAAVSPIILVSPDQTRRIALGGLGGRRIMTAAAQIVENIVDYGLGLDAAVNLPRIHADTIETFVDQRLPEQVFNRLRSRGLTPRVGIYGPTTLAFTRANAVSMDLATGATDRGIDLRSAATWNFGA